MSKILLIANSQPYLKNSLNKALPAEGHDIQHVEEVDQVSERIRMFKPDLVLLDLYLSGFERWDLIREIKQIVPATPVLILSAYRSFLDDHRTALADGYIFNDFNTDLIKQQVLDFLNARRRDTEN